MEPGEGQRVRRPVMKSEMQEVRKLMSLGKRGEGAGKRGLGWAGEVPRRGEWPQRRGVATLRRRAWQSRTETANQEFSKGCGRFAGGSRISAQERGLREALFGMEWPQLGDALKRQASYLVCLIVVMAWGRADGGFRRHQSFHPDTLCCLLWGSMMQTWKAAWA